MNSSADLLGAKLSPSKRLLTFCFIHPFDIRLRFVWRKFVAAMQRLGYPPARALDPAAVAARRLFEDVPYPTIPTSLMAL